MNPLKFAEYVLNHHDDPDQAYIDRASVRMLAMGYVMLHALHRETAGELAEADERFISLIAGMSNRAIEHGDVVRESTTIRNTKRALRALAALTIVSLLALLVVVAVPR